MDLQILLTPTRVIAHKDTIKHLRVTSDKIQINSKLYTSERQGIPLDLTQLPKT